MDREVSMLDSLHRALQGIILLHQRGCDVEDFLVGLDKRIVQFKSLRVLKAQNGKES